MNTSDMVHRWSLTKSFALALSVCCLLAAAPSAGAQAKAKAKTGWKEYAEVTLAPDVQLDGDSFGLKIPGARGEPKTYRLYGVDCPESDGKDKAVADRIKEQAEAFGCDEKDIPRMGKEAAEFTKKLLTKGKPRLLTKGEEVKKSPGRPQRYFAIVEVTVDGKPELLHELLLKNGHARAFGMPAPWARKMPDDLEAEEARAKFMRHLKNLESGARSQRLGVWSQRAGRKP